MAEGGREMNAALVIWILFVHWIADFICQDDKTAINKSRGIFYLLKHSLIYFGVLMVGYVAFLWVSPETSDSLLFLLNFPAHMAIDGVTSRVNARLYGSHRHWFFVVIGFDQFLHYAVLFLTI
jgi:hypothetical protein